MPGLDPMGLRFKSDLINEIIPLLMLYRPVATTAQRAEVAHDLARLSLETLEWLLAGLEGETHQ